jgi:hypothetical protein
VKRKFLIRVLVIIAVLWIPLTLLDKYYTSRVPKKISEKGIWILSKKNEKYDYAVTGSSRAFYNVRIKTIDSTLGLKGINLGIGGAGFAENYLTLKKFLENGNQLKLLCVQVDIFSLMDEKKAFSHPFSDHNYPFLIGDPSVDSVIRANSDPWKYYFRRYLPFFRYAEHNNLYPIDRVVNGFSLNGNPLDKEKGFCPLAKSDKNNNFLDAKAKPSERKVDDRSLHNLDELIKLAQRKNIPVVLFTAPIQAGFTDAFKANNEAATDTIRKIAARKRSDYFDFSKHPICNNVDLFKDATHLNYDGSTLYSLLLSDSLRKVLPIINSQNIK